MESSVFILKCCHSLAQGQSGRSRRESPGGRSARRQAERGPSRANVLEQAGNDPSGRESARHFEFLPISRDDGPARLEQPAQALQLAERPRRAPCPFEAGRKVRSNRRISRTTLPRPRNSSLEPIRGPRTSDSWHLGTPGTQVPGHWRRGKTPTTTPTEGCFSFCVSDLPKPYP